jgi:zinc/manganese transport system substrate-binding protein
VVVAIALAMPLLLRHAAHQTARPGALQVVAAENFWGNIAAQIGGDRVDVTSIISDPNTDPHLYESSANDAAAVAVADLVITNGLGYDEFMTKLLAGSGRADRGVVEAARVLGVSGPDANPHLWYDLPRVPQVAAAIEQSLAAQDPAHAAEYERNLQSFNRSLSETDTVIAAIQRKYHGAPVAYTESVPAYLLAAAGLQVKTPDGFARSIEAGEDPAPADSAAMQGLLTSRSIKVLLYNAQATSPVTQRLRDLARQNGIPVVGVTETLPAAASYQSWQLDQVRSLLNALGG